MMRHGHFAIVTVLAFSLAEPAAWPQGEADWPCIQPRVATLGIGQMWGGPALESAGDWHSDATVAELVPILAARRLPTEQAEAMIGSFAEKAGAAKDRQLTLLFAGLFEELNASRSRIIAGIERYARRQRELAQKINELRAEIAAQGLGGGMPEQVAPSELEQNLSWQTRIYDERAQMIAYVCESPVLIEQRLFALSRFIQNNMD